jgi:hypothetical protein
LAAHFRGKNPVVRELFDALRAELKKIGRTEMDSTKTRIAFRVLTNFVELTPQKNGLHCCLVLPRAVRDPRFFRVLSVSPRIHYHYFKLTARREIDAGLRRLLREGFIVGRREHRKGPMPPQPRTFPGVAREPSRFAQKPQETGTAPKRPLWRCPKCGWKFATRNLAHSCVRVPLAEHFRGKDPLVRKTFDALVRALRRNGPLTLVGSKTRITFMVRMRFGGVTPRKNSLPGGFFLLRPARHPLLRLTVRYGRTFGYRFELTHPKQIDAGFRRLLAEAYAVGQQKHLRAGRTTN